MLRIPAFLSHSICFLIVLLLSSCNLSTEKRVVVNSTNQPDTTEMIKNFIYGLWSLSDGNMLNNDGYYFQPDGIVRLVASEYSGEWKLIGKDSLEISLQFYSTVPQIQLFKIDSLNIERMYLSSEKETHAYRKVPFGINSDGTVLQGFMGEVSGKNVKNYELKLPTAKDIAIELTSENESIVFRFYEDENEITSTGLKKWKGILSHGGNYRLVVNDTGRKKPGSTSSYSLRVIGY